MSGDRRLPVTPAGLATIDGVTGVGNRRLYDERLLGAYRNAVRQDGPPGGSVDVVSRCGGEEFVILLPESDEAGAVAERIRCGRVAQGSLGVNSLATDDSTSRFAARAEAVLYRAKALGRNRTVTFERPSRPRFDVAGSRRHNRQAK